MVFEARTNETKSKPAPFANPAKSAAPEGSNSKKIQESKPRHPSKSPINALGVHFVGTRILFECRIVITNCHDLLEVDRQERGDGAVNFILIHMAAFM
jgi:hypothetical protein